MSRDDEDRWIDRTASDPDFADAVWSGRAPVEDAPAWYPRLVGLLGGARNRPPPGDAEVARRGAVWAEVQRRARRQRRRRRALVVGAAAMGAALAAGAAAAASDGGLSLPFVGWESGAGRSTVGGDAGDPARRVPAVPAVPAVEAEAVGVVEASEGRAPVAGTGGQVPGGQVPGGQVPGGQAPGGQAPGGRAEQPGAGCVAPGGRGLASDAVPLAATCRPGAVTSPDHSGRQRPSGVGRSADRAAATSPGDRPAPRAESRPGQRGGEDRRPVPAGAPSPVEAPPPLDAPPPAVDDAGEGSGSRRRAPARTDAGARHP